MCWRRQFESNSFVCGRYRWGCPPPLTWWGRRHSGRGGRSACRPLSKHRWPHQRPAIETWAPAQSVCVCVCVCQTHKHQLMFEKEKEKRGICVCVWQTHNTEENVQLLHAWRLRAGPRHLWAPRLSKTVPQLSSLCKNVVKMKMCRR